MWILLASKVLKLLLLMMLLLLWLLWLLIHGIGAKPANEFTAWQS